MSIRSFLAMTAAEFYSIEKTPKDIAWMACHFSCYGTGLSNLPRKLPPGSMVILNDRTPPQGHDPQKIAKQLNDLAQKHSVSYFLLDFQRPENPETDNLVNILTKELTQPVGVSDCYAKSLSCPVFLPPPPLHLPLNTYLEPWSGREVWLETAFSSEKITVTPEGSVFEECWAEILPDNAHTDESLTCRYTISVTDDRATFILTRDNMSFIEKAENLGVRITVGLYQQFKKHGG